MSLLIYYINAIMFIPCSATFMKTPQGCPVHLSGEQTTNSKLEYKLCEFAKIYRFRSSQNEYSSLRAIRLRKQKENYKFCHSINYVLCLSREMCC